MHMEYVSLTPHEKKNVLKLFANGHPMREIADELSLSFHTIESYRRTLLRKFDARNIADLIKKASKQFWFE